MVNDVGCGVDGTGFDEAPAAEVTAEISAPGGTAVASADSIATAEGAQAIVELALTSFGRIDAVVNNAGIIDPIPFLETEADHFAHQLEINLVGAFNVTRAAWEHLARAKAGRVVLTTSAAGLFGMPSQVAYASAKAGIIGLTRCLAAIGSDLGIRVNAIAPGAFTRMGEASLRDPRYAAFSAAFQRPASVAPLVAYLANQACTSTGELFSVAGGRVARVFIAETAGYTNAELTPEAIRDNWSQVQSEAGYAVPASTADSIAWRLKQLGPVAAESFLSLADFGG